MKTIWRALVSLLLPLSAAFAMQPPYALDLRDLMDAHYGVGNWSMRTGIGIGTDIGPALMDGLTTLRSQFGRGKILIPPGSWLMTNSPSPNLLSGNYIEGAGSQASGIIYNNFGGVAFQFSGAGGYSGGGIRGISLQLESGLGNTNAYGILLRGDATFQPDQMEFDDIYLTAVGASSFWWEGLHVDGTARLSPQGIRAGSINNLQIFNCHNLGIWLSDIVQLTMTNVGVYTGIGPNGNAIFVNGASTHIYGSGINGVLNIPAAPVTLDVMISGQRLS